jgi:hypothetical protein
MTLSLATLAYCAQAGCGESIDEACVLLLCLAGVFTGFLLRVSCPYFAIKDDDEIDVGRGHCVDVSECCDTGRAGRRGPMGIGLLVIGAIGPANRVCYI